MNRSEPRIGMTLSQSEPGWEAPVRASAGAPNVVVVVIDDLGFSDLGCFGSEIATPNIDALADDGVRLTNFHSSPLCSPTRASLLTGLNGHRAGFGFTTQADPGFPGYVAELPEEQPTLPESLRDAGYSTLMVGKWHLCREADMHEAGNKHSWPLQRGFDHFYGFLEAMTDFHFPHRLYDGNSAVQIDQYPDGYYLTDDLTDNAVQRIRDVKAADPLKPFFLYFAHGAVHAPLQAPRADIEEQRGHYDAGWDMIREQRFERQRGLGIVDAALPPRNHEPGMEVSAWDSVDPALRPRLSRYMEVYAAMVRSVDKSVGRLKDELRALGELDNTLFVLMSDNGASRMSAGAAEDLGTCAYLGSVTQRGGASAKVMEPPPIDEIGGPTTWPHYPRGWAMACNTPFRLYKLSTYRGGHQVPLVLSWPSGFDMAGGTIRSQYQHVTDLMPTILGLLDIPVPSSRHGMAALPLDGASFVDVLRDPAAASSHPEQFFECLGSRAYYRDGWEIVSNHCAMAPFGEHEWALFDVSGDMTQIEDRSAEHPELVRQLAAAWDQAARDNRVYPLNDGSGLLMLRRPPQPWLSSPVRLTPGHATLERHRAGALIEGESFAIDVAWSCDVADRGVVFSHGSQAGGYIAFVEAEALHVVQNDFGTARPLPAIPVTEVANGFRVEVTADGPGWEVSVVSGGRELSKAAGWSRMSGYVPFEGIDVGICRRSPVLWDLYEKDGTFPFTGRLEAVTYHPVPVDPVRRAELIAEAVRIGLEVQ